MRNRILAIAAIAGAIGAPIAAQAQSGSPSASCAATPSSSPTIRRHRGRSASGVPRICRSRTGADLHHPGSRGGRRRAAGSRRHLLRRAADLRRHALSLHRGERPDRAGRTAHPPHRSGGRLRFNRLNELSGRRSGAPDIKASSGLPHRAGLLFCVRSCLQQPHAVIASECDGNPACLQRSAEDCDCFARRARRNDGLCRHDFAISRRVSPEFCHQISSPSNQRAQGKPGARCTRGLVCNMHEQKRTRAYRFSGGIRLSLRNGFTAYTCSPRRSGFACHRRCDRLTGARLDASHRGVRTTRFCRPPWHRPSRQRRRVHRIPPPRP